MIRLFLTIVAIGTVVGLVSGFVKAALTDDPVRTVYVVCDGTLTTVPDRDHEWVCRP